MYNMIGLKYFTPPSRNLTDFIVTFRIADTVSAIAFLHPLGHVYQAHHDRRIGGFYPQANSPE